MDIFLLIEKEKAFFSALFEKAKIDKLSLFSLANKIYQEQKFNIRSINELIADIKILSTQKKTFPRQFVFYLPASDWANTFFYQLQTRESDLELRFPKKKK